MLLALAALASLLLAFDVLRYPQTTLQVGLFDVVLLFVVIAMIAHVQGLPISIARRLRIGLRSREWEFDRRLHIYREQLDTELSSYPSSRDWSEYGRWKRRTLSRGGKLLSGMRSLGPPDESWAHLRDGYVDLYDEILGRINVDDPPDDTYTMVRGTELKNEAAALRIQYRQAAHAAFDKGH